MLMLGISTSAKVPSAAVMRDGELILSLKDESGSSHSASLMELIDSALKEAGTEIADIDAVAVDVGPGSFTGVRIGVSCANAFAGALGINVIPISSLAALSNAVPQKGTVCALLDCRNGNCYYAVYVDGEETVPPCAGVTDEAVNSVPKDTVFVGDSIGERVFPDAALVLAEANRKGRPVFEAVPLYLRPPQAERMRRKY